MMFANDAAGEPVDADMAMPDGTYFCPKCGDEVRVVRRNGRAFFVHPVSSGHGRGRTGMTDWHDAWQKSFPENCREVVFDSGGVRHRADVLIGSVVLEFQHSGISDAEWSSRSSFYGPDCEKAVFWVYDRTCTDIRSDLGVSADGGLFGNESLAGREFRRSASVFGQDVPVFLDYGGYVAMCYDFVPCGPARYARSCILLTRSGFIELMYILGTYPWLIMEDFEMESYVMCHIDWFLDDVKLFRLEHPGPEWADLAEFFRMQAASHAPPAGVSGR